MSFINEFRDKQQQAYQTNVAHGFHEGSSNFAEKIALIHSELSEALEYYRKGDQRSDHISEFTGVEEEFADVVIRIMDVAQDFNYRVADAVVAKMAFNETRPYKHGGKRF